MGTRALTVFVDDMDQKEIVVMYRQFDGYPKGHGKDLRAFLRGYKITNGISELGAKKHANGMSCLAGQVISRFKTEYPYGNIYLYPAGTRDVGEEYVYTVSCENGKPKVKCK